MVKVLHVLTDSNIGGAGRSILSLLPRLDREKFLLACAIPKGSLLKPELEALGTKLEVYELIGISDRSFDLGSILTFMKLFRQAKPDIVHTHAGLSARVAAKLLGKKIVYTRHWVGNDDVGIIKEKLNGLLCDAAIGVSQAARECVIHMGVKPNKAFLVYNGIEPFRQYAPEEKQNYRKMLGYDDSHYVIGTAARLEKEKGIEYLLHAAKTVIAAHPFARFVIAGDGSIKPQLIQLVEELSLCEYVKFSGFVRDMEGFLNSLDLYALPSLTEAFGLTIAEAASVTCPCVATACDGVVEIMENEKTGLIVPVGDSVALADAIIRMMDNKTQAQWMSEQSRKRIMEIFTAKKMAEKMEAIYGRMTRC